MANETVLVDLCTPPLTPLAKSKIENAQRDTVGSHRGDDQVEYTLKPATRAYASTARLNLQHYLWKDQTGYLLHPSISLLPNDHLKIADVGTGTGIWLLDFARTLPPSTQLDGFDIDISDCPHEQWLPSNVKIRQLDALGEIPKHLVGVYDIVHLRLFQVVVNENDPGPLLRNMLKMLKPGGYLQWSEYDMTTQTTIKANPSLSSSALQAIPTFVQGFKKKDERIGKQNWIPLLPLIFHTHHLTQITTSRHPTAPAFLQHQLDIFLLTYEELAAKTLDKLPATTNSSGDVDDHNKGGRRRNGGYGDKLRELIEAASQESRKGVGWSMDRLVVVGRKARAGSEAVGVFGDEQNNTETKPIPAGKFDNIDDEQKSRQKDKHSDGIINPGKATSCAAAEPGVNNLFSDSPPATTTAPTVPAYPVPATATSPSAVQEGHPNPNAAEQEQTPRPQQPPPQEGKKTRSKRRTKWRAWLKRVSGLGK